MAKYLWQVSYTQEGMKGLLKEGGTGRRAAVEQLTKELGGNVEAYYYAFGSDDVVIIGDLPDHVTTAAIAMTVAASGAAKVRTTVLMTPEEVDDATQKSVNYRPPGA